jgi:hypothetical protein
LERLRSPEVKRAGKADPATAGRVERAIARAEREKTAATDLKASRRRAITALEEDLAKLLA